MLSHQIKKIILSIFTIVTFGLLVTTTHAINLGIDDVNKAGKEAGYAQATETSFAENVGRAITILFSILGVLFTILIVYAGYLWMTARGNEENVTKAKGIISTSIIGLIILLMAYSITSFVVPRLLQGSVNTSATPATP